MTKNKTFSRVMHYIGWKGDSSFIETGEKPHCAQCGSTKLKSEIEIIQRGFAGDKVWLVSHCKQCLNTTVFDYEIALVTPTEIEREILDYEKEQLRSMFGYTDDERADYNND